MANISDLLKHPVLLAIIPAAIGLGGTLYASNKDKPTEPAKVQVEPATAEVDTQTDEAQIEAAQVEAALDIEKTFWASIQPPLDSEDSYCAYLHKYPQGNFVELAQEHCSAETLDEWQAKKKKAQAEITAEKAESAATQ
jgi:hypothetical protein